MEKTHKSHSSRTLPKYLTKVEVLEMLATAKLDKRRNSNRNHLILLSLWRTGMRVSEIIALRKQDIKGSTIIVRDGKGHKDRVIPLESELDNLLGLYSDRMSPKDRLFPLSDRQIRYIVQKYSPTGTKVFPHMIRHSFAVYCIKNGMNIRSLQKILGHHHLNTTQVYLDLTGQDVKEDFNKIEW